MLNQPDGTQTRPWHRTTGSDPQPGRSGLGRRFIRLLDGQLRQLRDHAQHGNRSFFYDQLVVAHLLAFFSR